MKHQKLKIIFIFIFFVLANEAKAGSASLFLSPPSGTYVVNSTFSIKVNVNSGGEAINAAEGTLVYNPAELSVISVSKSNSIFTLWTTEPTFSNSTGNISFGGGTPSNFTGTNGTILSIAFKAKASATSQVNFSSGSILAADGKGTNVLATMNSGVYTLKATVITPPAEELSSEQYVPPPTPEGAPLAPVISFSTHPDPEKWYSNNNPQFSWTLPSDVNGVSIYFSKSPTSNPGSLPDGLFSAKSYENVEDGIWYFHIKFRNSYGWGQITHFKVQIDTKPPQPFEITVKEGKETTNPRPILNFKTKDDLSGIEYYEIKIGDKDAIPITVAALEHNPFQMPLQSPGKYTVIVKAVDRAENYTLAMTEINILPIEAPIITDYPQALLPGATLLIKGTAVPEVIIKVYIQKDEKEVKIDETKSDKEGKWSYIGTEPLEKGIYRIWAEAIDSLGARSKPSEKVTIQVIPPVFIRIGKLAIDYLTTIITLLVLILVIVFGIIWGWQKIKQKRKRLKKEITEAEKTLYQAFKALREETKEQIEKLDGKPGLNKREKKICEDLKKALKISEEFIGKEIKDIEKELE